MLIYHFRIWCEEHEGFLREIEIQPNQTFLDFHYILMESAELLHCERASFFMTDKKYKKDREISLKAEKRQIRKYDEDLDKVITESLTLPLMKTEKLKNYIEDPHQKMIYEFVGRDIISFHIELFKILPAEGITSYPLCTKRLGELPRKADQPVVVPDVPVVPRVVVPRIPVPKLEELVKFDDIVENEQELISIENELDELMEETIPEPVYENVESEDNPMTDFLFEGEEEVDEETNISHIEDYEDIESLDKRLSGFDHASGDY